MGRADPAMMDESQIQEPDGDDATGDTGEDAATGPGQIRALARGLAALEVLNQKPCASVTDIANATGLARTTAYRVLETLCTAGLATRTAEERYCLLPSVRRLSDGFDDEPWIAAIAKPTAAALAKDLAWPLMLATLHGSSMKAHRLNEGPGEALPRLPLTGSAAGLAYLAAAPPAQRAAVLDVLKASGETLADDLAQTLDDFAARGAAKFEREANVGLAVPVRLGDGVIGCLVVTVPRTALAVDPAQDQGQALDRIAALLTHAAAEIAAALTIPKAEII
jgi:IclR family mhp operon transcriptional activator